MSQAVAVSAGLGRAASSCLSPSNAGYVGPFNNVGCGATCDMTYNTANAPVMHQPVNYLIFWLPPNYHFDNATIDPGAIGPSDAKYESLIQRYFQDVRNSSFYNILSQYNGSGVMTSLGGAWVDTSAFPGGRGALGNGLTETDIHNEILNGISANPSWTSNNGNNEFLVFEPYKVFTSTDGLSYCAHHSYFTNVGTPIIYSNMQDDGSLGCLTTAYNHSLVLAGPNGDPFADSEISTISHEQFESVSDPRLNAWYYVNTSGEIGDECNGYYGPGAGAVEPDGSNIYVNGHPYIVQFEWSNSNHGCVLDLTGPPVQATVNLNPSGGSNLSPDSYFALAYIEAGVATLLPQADFHGSSIAVWIDQGTQLTLLQGPAALQPNEQWCLVISSGSCSTQHFSFAAGTGGTFAYYYYDVLRENASFSILGGGSASSPSFSYVASPSTPTTTDSPVNASLTLSTTPQTFWILRGSSPTVPKLLSGSTSSERWITANATWSISGPNVIPSPITYQHQYFVSFTASPPGTGSVTANNNASLTSGFFNAGGVVSLNAKASKGYVFSSWSATGGTSFGSVGSVSTTVMIGSAGVITANFLVASSLLFPPALVIFLIVAVFSILILRTRRRGLMTRNANQSSSNA